jgi:hypothetical protein
MISPARDDRRPARDGHRPARDDHRLIVQHSTRGRRENCTAG